MHVHMIVTLDSIQYSTESTESFNLLIIITTIAYIIVIKLELQVKHKDACEERTVCSPGQGLKQLSL